MRIDYAALISGSPRGRCPCESAGSAAEFTVHYHGPGIAAMALLNAMQWRMKPLLAMNPRHVSQCASGGDDDDWSLAVIKDDTGG